MNDDILHFGTALGIGLLIGAERERRKADSPSDASAGVRTFALAALAGCVAARFGGTAVFAVTIAGVVVLAATAYLRARAEDLGLTTEVALVLTALLGGASTLAPALAAGLAVVTTILLAARSKIHHFVRQALSARELEDALVLAAAALVILPLVPDRYIGPFDAINPRTLWLLVVLIMAIGAVGHIAQRVLGARLGLPAAGFASGFISSSATIGAMGGLAQRSPELASPAVAGAVLSSVATVFHLAVVLLATSPATLVAMAIPLTLAGLVAIGYGMVFLLRAAREAPATQEAVGSAFSIKVAIGIATGLAAILVIAAAASAHFGAAGIAIVSGAAGFADAQSAAVSAASLVASGKLTAASAVAPVLVGMTTNTVTKGIFAWTGGGARFTAQVAPGLVLMLAAAWLGALMVPS